MTMFLYDKEGTAYIVKDATPVRKLQQDGRAVRLVAPEERENKGIYHLLSIVAHTPGSSAGEEVVAMGGTHGVLLFPSELDQLIADIERVTGKTLS